MKRLIDRGCPPYDLFTLEHQSWWPIDRAESNITTIWCALWNLFR